MVMISENSQQRPLLLTAYCRSTSLFSRLCLSMWLRRSVRLARHVSRRLGRNPRASFPAAGDNPRAFWVPQQRLYASGSDGWDSNDNEARFAATPSSPGDNDGDDDDDDFFNEFSTSFSYDDDDEEEDDDAQDEDRRQQIRDELDQRKGREWSDPWELTDEDFMHRTVLDDLPDWIPTLCSRISVERVKVHPDGIPALSTLATLSLPPPPPPHPALVGDSKAYGKERKRYIQSIVEQKVAALAAPQIPSILAMRSWDDKQNAIDELYESVEVQLKQNEAILGRSPYIGTWVEQALESYLRRVDAENRKQTENDESTDAVSQAQDAGADGKDETETKEEAVMDDDNADPIFMDLFDPEDGPETVVPKILHPLRPHERIGPGRMVEEWELSAQKKTKRILLRQCTRLIAQALESNPTSRVYVNGQQGVGKSAALTAIVGSARKSGYIVLYLPEGNRLRRHGKYIEPNLKRKGIFDLPVLAQEVCGQFLSSHKGDMDGMVAPKETMDMLFTEDQLKRLDPDGEAGGEFSLVQLLEIAHEKKSLASMCYSAVVRTLMEQDEKPFLMVLDEFNCYFDQGHYFHMEYDETVRKAIPCHQISLFQPALEAMGLSLSPLESTSPPYVIKRGGIVVGTTESHAVARKFTDGLTAAALAMTTHENAPVPLVVVDVPRYSLKEADHIISNMEVIGIGRLRFDRGHTVTNINEMGYLRMVSGCVGQHLLDACIV